MRPRHPALAINARLSPPPHARSQPTAGVYSLTPDADAAGFEHVSRSRAAGADAGFAQCSTATSRRRARRLNEAGRLVAAAHGF
jgi:hypothetical protein